MRDRDCRYHETGLQQRSDTVSDERRREGEFGVIARIRDHLGRRRTRIEGIGDDACVLREDDGRVVSMDTMVQDVHFDLRWSRWEDVGFKLFAVNASDIFAMGAVPSAALFSMAIDPDRVDVDGLVRGLKEGIATIAPDVDVVGGDTTRTTGPAVLTLTMIGRARSPILSRSEARPGQTLWVNGPLGLAATGLACLRADMPVAEIAPRALAAHRRPQPRPLDVAQLRAAGASAGIDISDGLCADLMHIAIDSDVAVELVSELHGFDEVRNAARPLGLGEDGARDLQIYGGDDYVIVVSADASPGEDFIPIGRVVRGSPGLTIVCEDGTRKVPMRGGYTHF